MMCYRTCQFSYGSCQSGVRVLLTGVSYGREMLLFLRECVLRVFHEFLRMLMGFILVISLYLYGVFIDVAIDCCDCSGITHFIGNCHYKKEQCCRCYLCVIANFQRLE